MSAASIRLVVCDVDGTLVRHDKSLSEGTVAAGKRLMAAGIPLALISARPMSGLRGIMDALGLGTPCGAFNGATLFDRSGPIGRPDTLAPASVRQILARLDAGGIDAWLFANDLWYARNTSNPHTPRERLSAGLEPTLCRDLGGVAGPVDKIVGVSDDARALAGIEASLREEIGGAATIARSQTYFLDATGPRGNKGDGLVALASAMAVALDAVAVMGDMHNDLPMFAKAGLSIAMGQAPEDVRKAADWTTASNEEDGVAQAIDRLLAER